MQYFLLFSTNVGRFPELTPVCSQTTKSWLSTLDAGDTESEPNTPLHDADDSTSNQSDETQNPTSQNDEADARLVHVAWLRKTSDNVYMSNRKAINLRL